MLETRRDNGYPVVIVIHSSETGAGKSTLAIQLSQALDPTFRVEQIVESAVELEALYQEEGWGMHVYDEGGRGLMSNKGSRDKEQSGLIDTITTQRKNLKGLVICIHTKQMLDAIINWRLANFVLFIRQRGTATVEQAWKGDLHKKSQSLYPYQPYAAIPRISWRNLDRTRFFKQYLERAQQRNRDKYRKRAMDPLGLLRECPFCGLNDTALEVARHDCPGLSGTRAAGHQGPPPQEKDNVGRQGHGTGRTPPGGVGVSASLSCGKCGKQVVGAYNLSAHEAACEGKA